MNLKWTLLDNFGPKFTIQGKSLCKSTLHLFCQRELFTNLSHQREGIKQTTLILPVDTVATGLSSNKLHCTSHSGAPPYKLHLKIAVTPVCNGKPYSTEQPIQCSVCFFTAYFLFVILCSHLNCIFTITFWKKHHLLCIFFLTRTE